MEKGEWIKGERRGRRGEGEGGEGGMGEGRVRYREREEGERGMGEGRVGSLPTLQTRPNMA